MYFYFFEKRVLLSLHDTIFVEGMHQNFIWLKLTILCIIKNIENISTIKYTCIFDFTHYSKHKIFYTTISTLTSLMYTGYYCY